MTPGKVENVFYIESRFLNLVSDFPYSLSSSPCMVNSGPSVSPHEGAEVFGLTGLRVIVCVCACVCVCVCVVTCTPHQ